MKSTTNLGETTSKPGKTAKKSSNSKSTRLLISQLIHNSETPGAGEYPHSVSWDKKIEIINAGISKTDLIGLKKRYEFTLEDLSRILGITPRTIQSKKADDIFTGTISEKLLALAEIYSYGLEVFADEARFKNWLNTPNPVLKNFKPVDLLSTMTGMEEVKHELGRIDYGVY